VPDYGEAAAKYVVASTVTGTVHWNLAFVCATPEDGSNYGKT